MEIHSGLRKEEWAGEKPALLFLNGSGSHLGQLNFGVMDKTGAKKRRSPYAVRLSGVESL